jgi:hypothetical protein
MAWRPVVRAGLPHGAGVVIAALSDSRICVHLRSFADHILSGKMG